jgi:hypothetical protein
MTSEQQRLYAGILRLFRTFGTGGATWRRTRTTGGAPDAGAAVTQVGGIVIRFCQNNRIVKADTLPQIPIFTAPWWGVADASVDVRGQDIFDNGTIAFLITGAPDSSQGFYAVPAAKVTLPRSLVLQVGGGYQAGLRIGAW